MDLFGSKAQIGLQEYQSRFLSFPNNAAWHVQSYYEIPFKFVLIDKLPY